MDRWIELAEKAFPSAKFGPEPHRAEAWVGPIDGLFTNDDLDAFRSCTAEAAVEFVALLEHPLHRHLVKLLVFATRHVPEWLVDPMLLAAARTVDPSFNKHFVVPCVLLFGRRRVVGALDEIARTGSDPLKVGAANAIYWGSIGREELRWPDDRGHHPYEGPLDDPVHDLLERFKDWALGEFVENECLDVRRALVHYVSSSRLRATEIGRAAIEIARNHPDSFIRERLQYDSGESSSIPCMPHRGDAG